MSVEHQRALLIQIAAFIERYGYSPSLRELQLACGISSSSVVIYNLDALERHGLIERQREIARSVRLTDAGRASLAMKEGRITDGKADLVRPRPERRRH